MQCIKPSLPTEKQVSNFFLNHPNGYRHNSYGAKD